MPGLPNLYIVFFAVIALAPLISGQEWPVQTFWSSSMEPPMLNITKRGKTEQGYIFLSPTDNLKGQGAPTIFTGDGELVWQGSSGNISAFQPQTLNGEPVLTYWSGVASTEGFGYGAIFILDQQYRQIHQITLPDDSHNFQAVLESKYGSYIDLHESAITPQGTILVTALNITQTDLRSVGGPRDGWVYDSQFYEIDIETNQVLFRWSALDHLAPVDSFTPLDGTGLNKSNPWNFAHLNSIMRYGDKYLVSSHGFCSIYAIDSNGNILWTMNGQLGGDFTMALDTQFCFQHDARIEAHTNSTVTMHIHNNNNVLFSKGTSATTGLLLDVDLEARSVSLSRRLWDAEETVYAESQGSYQNLVNGHVFLGHGATPKVEEYDENGAVVMRAQFGYNNIAMSYRAYRAVWTGKPTTRPSIYACNAQLSTGTGKEVRLYVSWNGATEVQSWEVYLGANKTALKKVATTPRNGFETEIRLGEPGSYSMVKAIGGSNTTSAIIKVEDC